MARLVPGGNGGSGVRVFVEADGESSPESCESMETTGQFRKYSRSRMRHLGLAQIAALLSICGVVVALTLGWSRKADKSQVDAIEHKVDRLIGYVEGITQLPDKSPLRQPQAHILPAK